MVQVTVLGVSLVSAAREIDAIRPERFRWCASGPLNSSAFVLPPILICHDSQ